MHTSTSLRWLVVAVSAAMLLAVVAACSSETIEVPGETVVVEKEVVKTVEVPGETVVKEVVKEVMVPGETVVVKEEVVKEVMVPGETVVVEKEVVKTVEVPGETVTVEVVKEVQVPGETVVVEKVVTQTVQVPGETVVVEKVVTQTVEVPGATVVVEKEVVKTVEVPGPERVMVKEVAGKRYVTDPTTGKAVSVPTYGGTLTYPHSLVGETTDPFRSGGSSAHQMGSVNQHLGTGDWATNREVYDFRDTYPPDFTITGQLAESWETPDPLTYIFHIRQGVHYALDQNSEASRLVNGRELTADDVVWTYQRNNVLGDFTEQPGFSYGAIKLPWESIEATDKYTVVVKLTEPSLVALRLMLVEGMQFILPPEVIETYGNYEDWKNVVGTGPIMLTDYVDGISTTWEKNPDYWGYDPKYPRNRLPYFDRLRALRITEEATRLAALRTGKVDIISQAGGGADINSLDVVRSLQRTNPELEVHSYFQRAFTVYTLNIRNPPLDDIRVRHALQMALDLETVANTYHGGYARWEPMGGLAVKPYLFPFEEWPEDLKQYYTYNPEGAEKLLDEAGYRRGADGVRFKLAHDHRDIMDLGYAEIAAGYWADIGIDVEVNVVPGLTWWGNRGGSDGGEEDINYELSTGDSGFYSAPTVWVGFYDTALKSLREYTGGKKTPELTAAYDAFFAATTREEQLKAFREYDLILLRQHNQIWGPMAPRYQVNQPWVKGFNGEMMLEESGVNDVLVHLWIDQELKEAMGR